MNRVFNFSAGPSMLPLPVLERAASELVCYGTSGMSVMEMSHRSPDYEAIIEKAQSDLRRLMNIPDNYKVLFLQGGASTQFAAVPLNLIRRTGKADYLVSGQFSGKAFKEAQKLGYDVVCAATTKDVNFSYVPTVTRDMIRPDAAYVHMCFNNTIYGTRYTAIPDTGNVPLVADMSSNILSEPFDVTKFGVIFAGAQKNIGPAGLCIVIVRRDLMGHEDPKCPKLMSWALESKNDSMLNTPNTYGIYMAGLGFEWLKGLGGVNAIYEQNKYKAGLLYDYLDQSALFKAPARRDCRSLMNVTFVTESDELNAKFVSEAAEAGFVNLKGHRSVGGMRASIYNAMPVEGVEQLVDFMKEFEKNN